MKKLPYPRQIAMEALFTGHGPSTFKGKEHNLRRSYLVELFLENAEMPGVILDGSNLRRACLVGTNLNSARLPFSDLQEADLRSSNLQNCLLFNTNLINANLRGADLRGADLTRAKLQGAALDDAKLDGVEQAARAASLFRTTGLPPEMVSELLERRPSLFQKPENPDDNPDYFAAPLRD